MAKHIVKNKVWPEVFVVGKVAESEQNVLLDFGQPAKYEVVKLAVKDLPRADSHGRKIRWINSWAIQDSRGRYPKKVHYTVFVRAPRKKATFIYHDQRGLHRGKAPASRGSKPPREGWLQVDFHAADPAIGII